MNGFSTQRPDEPWPDFGPPEFEFRPTFGQTAAGLLIHGSCAAGIFACAFFDQRLDAFARVVVGSCGVTSLGMAYWAYALRRWRLWVCPDGVIQRRAWAVDAIKWSEVHEAVVERGFFTRHPDNVTLVRHGAGGAVTVRPINCGRWREAVAAVLRAANDHRIPVRNVRASSD